jgi:hypothetical protein
VQSIKRIFSFRDPERPRAIQNSGESNPSSFFLVLTFFTPSFLGPFLVAGFGERIGTFPRGGASGCFGSCAGAGSSGAGSDEFSREGDRSCGVDGGEIGRGAAEEIVA